MNIVVIGASSSIGRSLVGKLKVAGHHVFSASSEDVNLLDRVSIWQFSKVIFEAFDHIDVLIFLAGICPGKKLEAYTADTIDKIMQVNFIGPATLVNALLPWLTQAHIIWMSSISSGGSYDPFYAASKAAIDGFVRSLAQYGGEMRVNAIAPGLIEGSTMWEAMAIERRAAHLRQTPSGKLTTIDEITDLIVQMTGPAWANVRGHILRVDGGRSCGLP